MPMPRKDDALHKLHSTTPHDRTPDTPSPLVASRPKYPKDITPAGKKVFKELVKLLLERRVLTSGDRYLLELYVGIWDRRARAQAKLLQEGEVTTYARIDSNGKMHQCEKLNLNLKIVTDAEKQLVGILDRLGLSPLAGPKIKQTRETQVEEEAKPGTVAYMILHQGDKK
jgi:P27 family predicted phage terminase small subunit